MHPPSRALFDLLHYALVSGTDYLAGAYQFLDTVRRPADYAGDGEQRSVQLQRDTQHIVYESAVKIHVGTYALVDAALLGD